MSAFGRRQQRSNPCGYLISLAVQKQQLWRKCKSISALLHIVFWVIRGQPTARLSSLVLGKVSSRCPAGLDETFGTPGMPVTCCENARYQHFGRQQRRGTVLLERVLRHHADPLQIAE